MTEVSQSDVEATDPPAQAALARALLEPAVYGLDAGAVTALETHTSHVFLAGPRVYKIKKAVDLGFLDFRSLPARHFFCLEELRLNRRFAPDLYLGLTAITGTPRQPVLGGSGEVIEWAVTMRRFPQEQRLDELLAAGRLGPALIDELALMLARVHAGIAVATDADAFGTPEAVREPALENFVQLGELLDDPMDAFELTLLRDWTAGTYKNLHREFAARKQAGFVRECHGDLHLANIALVQGAVTLFDCLEFSAALRWIDVMNDMAFLLMDLQSKRCDALAQRLLNHYLERTGDYAGLKVLDFYRVYRALVRAKVACLSAGQTQDEAERRSRREEYHAYVALAKSFTQQPAPVLIITHGLAGSGKTTGSQALLELIGAVRIRSDVERKRLAGVAALARTGSGLGQGLYTADASARTYEQLLFLAREIIAAGYSVIVDAAFLKRAQRDAFRALADALRIPFWIVDFSADENLLRERVQQRAAQLGDASEADADVLSHQIASEEPLAESERGCVFRCDAAALAASDATLFWAPLLLRLRDAHG